MAQASTCYWFDSQTAATDPLIRPARARVKSSKAGRIRCRKCKAVITDREQAIRHGGNHVHEATNPAGFTYRFACYQSAPGCARAGAPTFEHSWFSGYSWQIAFCKSCGEHLGWAFSGADRFYGLIVDRLLDDDQLSA